MAKASKREADKKEREAELLLFFGRCRKASVAVVPKAGLALQGAPKGDTAERCASVQRTETTESFVRVLSPALAQKKDRASQLGLLVPKAGLEPARCRHHRILSPARLPIPPLRRDLLYYISTKERLWQ